MSENQKINFHKRQFKAYLALRGMTKKSVAKKIGMSRATFTNKSIHSEGFKAEDRKRTDKDQQLHFSEAECLQIVEVLGISPQWQRRIFSKVLVK